MRLLIAGGGTGGHIYPALAVARSLRDRPNAPELVWLGGHRGLEAALVRAAGIPRPPARAALAPDGRHERPRRPRPDPPRRCPCPRPRRSSPASGRPRSSRPAATSRSRRSWPPRRCGSRSSSGTATSSRAGRSGCTARLADAIAVVARGDRTGARPGRRAVVPDRDADPRRRPRSTAARRGPGSSSRPTRRVMLIFGGSQAVRRFNAAVTDALPRLVERGHDPARRPATTATRRRSPRASACPPTRSRATGRTRSCATRCCRRSSPRTSSSGGPARRRWPRSRPSESRRSSSRTRTPRATRPRTREVLAEAGRGAARRRTRPSTPTRSSRRPTCSPTTPPGPRMADAARPFGRPGRRRGGRGARPRRGRAPAVARCRPRSSGSRAGRPR